MKYYPVSYGESTFRDQFGIYGDSSLLQNDLGWRPKVELKNCLIEMAEW